ncbi:MAG TPA: AMIN domain-containing protein, partial [Terriglobales bacterium]|nr:AMIN domain-containing protein [Terriglobales bacterium]
MRKQFLGTISALLAIVLMAGAQTASAQVNGYAALEKVGVSRGDGGISIEITAKGTITPKVETLSSPARIVVDLPNTVQASALNRIRVGSSGVASVRIGTDSEKTTRVVVDLDRLCKYELLPEAGNKIVLKLDTGAAQPAAEAQKSVPSPAAPAPVQAAVSQPPVNNSASNFQFVEPAFTPKKDVAQVDPPARSVDAASKFVERPEGNLLPGSSAAMQSDNSSASPVTPQASPIQIQPAVNLAAEQKE